MLVCEQKHVACMLKGSVSNTKCILTFIVPSDFIQIQSAGYNHCKRLQELHRVPILSPVS